MQIVSWIAGWYFQRLLLSSSVYQLGKSKRIHLESSNCYPATRTALAVAVAIASRGIPIGLMQPNHIRAVGDVGQSPGLGHQQGEITIADSILNPLHNTANEQLHSLLNVGPSAGARLDIGQTIALSQSGDLLPANDAQLQQVTFVATEHYVRVFCVGVHAQLFQPVGDLQKRLLAGQIEDEQKAHRIPIECRCQ